MLFKISLICNQSTNYITSCVTLWYASHSNCHDLFTLINDVYDKRSYSMLVAEHWSQKILYLIRKLEITAQLFTSGKKKSCCIR